MFGANAFGWPSFGEPYPDFLGAGGAGTTGGHYAKTGKKRKRKHAEIVAWPAVIWPNEVPKKKPAPVAVPVEALAAPVQTAGKPVAVTVKATSGKPDMIILDPALQRRMEALQARLRQELEDEEILLLLGAFD